MQKILDVTEELKVYANNYGTPNLYFRGASGLRLIICDPVDDTADKLARTGLRLVAMPTVMQRLRHIDTTAGLFHLLIRELGLNEAIREIEALGNAVRVMENGNTAPANPDSPPFSYDKLSDPPEKLLYEHNGSSFHFQLTLAGDEVAFFHRASIVSGFKHHDIEPDIRAFAVKRLYEIYRSDQSKAHLAWVSDLVFAGDLGL